MLWRRCLARLSGQFGSLRAELIDRGGGNSGAPDWLERGVRQTLRQVAAQEHLQPAEVADMLSQLAAEMQKSSSKQWSRQLSRSWVGMALACFLVVSSLVFTSFAPPRGFGLATVMTPAAESAFLGAERPVYSSTPTPGSAVGQPVPRPAMDLTLIVAEGTAYPSATLRARDWN